ncbi:MAG: hypothetical protein JWP47_586 [Polaromonas sp.]|nr:hypothetical protein [Polaromonas sp.]
MTEHCASATAASVWLATACFCLGGCALPPAAPYGAKESAQPFQTAGMTMQEAQRSLRPGTTGKADVAALLGKATVIAFDSGYEVWVYRAGATGASAGGSEFVVLFTPGGLVKKSRIRSP